MPTNDTAIEAEVHLAEGADAPVEGSDAAAQVDADQAAAAALSEVPAAVVIDPSVELADLRSQLATVKDLLAQVVQTREPKAEPAKVIEPPKDDEPNAEKTPADWVGWKARQEFKAAAAPLHADLQTIKEQLSKLLPIAEEREYGNHFHAAVRDLAKTEPKFLDTAWGTKVATTIDKDADLSELSRSNPRQALSLAMGRVKDQEVADSIRKELAALKAGRNAQALASTPRGAATGGASRVVGVPKSTHEAIQQAVSELRASGDIH